MMALQDRPPTNWKRPAMPASVRLQVTLNQDGRDAVTGERLGDIKNVQFDHRPALCHRQFDPIANDTVPAANDPAYIQALSIKTHDTLTHGPGGEKRITTAGSDTHRRAKEKRVSAQQEGFRRRILARHSGDETEATASAKPARAWPKQKIQSRGFQKRERPSRE